MHPSLALRMALLGVLLAACASTNVSLPEQEPREVSWEEGCQEDTTLELVCAEDICAFFRCKDMVDVPEAASGQIEPARSPGLRPPGGWRRGWRMPRRDTVPVFQIRWHNHPTPTLPSQRPLMWDRLVKHHIFPQAPRLAEWFRRQGINIHRYTLLIPRSVHIRIHSGGARGGRWNEEWRHFIEGRPRATPEQIWEHAIKLIVKYDLAGAQMAPYR